MTVKELIKNLETLPQDAKVTDGAGNVLCEVCSEPKEDHSGYWVWLEFIDIDID